ncbi:MAG: aminotransferase class V-fold PLP-dependent enzyme [bacterium]
MSINTQFIQTPESAYQPARRRFLQQLLGGVTATATLPSLLFAKNKLPLEQFTQAAKALASSGDERFWQLVKEQFPLRKGLILMNAANLCPTPYPVIEAVNKLARDVDADASFQNRGKFRELHEQTVQALAEYLGADTDEVVITRNTSEGNNLVVGGLDLKTGDEVVIWDQNHPTNNVAWDVRAQRYGFSVKRVSTPNAPKHANELIVPFENAITKNTRVLAFSHISNVSGVALPVKEICTLAREKNILTLVDGAQSFGFLDLDLHDLGCDFFTGSAHKWFVGPKEAGILFVRKERGKDLWPIQVGVGWEQAKERGAWKFSTLGQREDARVCAMKTAIDFHNSIGKNNVEKRVRQIAATLKSKIGKRISGTKFHTPLKPEQSGGVVVFALPRVDARKAFQTLYEKHNIGCAPMRGDFTGIRLSPHIYNTMEEVERVVATLEELAVS